jgi:hypothetical protein
MKEHKWCSPQKGSGGHVTMLLVGCLGTALYWDGRLLTLERNFLTLFFSWQLSVTIHRMSPPLHSIHQKGLLFRVRQTNTFPCYRTELVGVCANQFWRWTSLSNAVIYFSAVLPQILKRHIKNVMTCPYTSVGVTVELVLLHGIVCYVIQVHFIQMIVGANVFRRWEQRLHVTSTTHLNEGHSWTVQM